MKAVKWPGAPNAPVPLRRQACAGGKYRRYLTQQ